MMLAREQERNRRSSDVTTETKPEVKAPVTEPKPEAPKAAVAKPQVTETPKVSGKYQPNDVIRLLVKESPKREGSQGHAKFACFVDGMTIAEFYEAGAKALPGKSKWFNGEISVCVAKKWIKIEKA